MRIKRRKKQEKVHIPLFEWLGCRRSSGERSPLFKFMKLAIKQSTLDWPCCSAPVSDLDNLTPSQDLVKYGTQSKQCTPPTSLLHHTHRLPMGVTTSGARRG